MKKIKLSNFKAFENIEIDIPEKEGSRNILLYGENGAGKSTIYEAIRYFYFKDRVRNIPPNVVGQQRLERIQDFEENLISKFSAATSFGLEIDDVSYATFSPSQNSEVFMVSSSDLMDFRDCIKIHDIIDKAYFYYDRSVTIDATFNELLIEHINNSLTDTFKSELKVELHANGYLIVKDRIHGLKLGTELSKYYNESCITVMILLVLLGSILLLKRGNHNTLLVFDDIITSLDSGSRYALTKYILDNFNGCQIFIFTHNAGFFNLFHHISTAFKYKKSYFNEYELYTVDGIHKIQEIGVKTAAEIREGYKNSNDIQVAGNEIRRSFESNIVSISRYFRIGAIEQTQEVISQILAEKNLYYYKGEDNHLKGARDLIDEIKSILSNTQDPNRVKKTLSQIKEYENSTGIKDLIPIIRELNALKKIAMHPASHGRHNPRINVTSKEIYTSLGLLEKLEALNKSSHYLEDVFPL